MAEEHVIKITHLRDGLGIVCQHVARTNEPVIVERYKRGSDHKHPLIQKGQLMATRHSNRITAVGYARRSTDMQERSIPDQQAFVERWADEHGYRIVCWYIDDAVSGTSTRGRNAFEQLLQGVKSWQAKQYSVKLARDTIRGQISNIQERRSAPGGVAPYGYDKQHLASDGTVLRTLRWLADGSK